MKGPRGSKLKQSLDGSLNAIHAISRQLVNLAPPGRKGGRGDIIRNRCIFIYDVVDGSKGRRRRNDPSFHTYTHYYERARYPLHKLIPIPDTVSLRSSVGGHPSIGLVGFIALMESVITHLLILRRAGVEASAAGCMNCRTCAVAHGGC